VAGETMQVIIWRKEAHCLVAGHIRTRNALVKARL
jgi:hypothetical protein